MTDVPGAEPESAAGEATAPSPKISGFNRRNGGRPASPQLAPFGSSVPASSVGGPAAAGTNGSAPLPAATATAAPQTGSQSSTATPFVPAQPSPGPEASPPLQVQAHSTKEYKTQIAATVKARLGEHCRATGESFGSVLVEAVRYAVREKILDRELTPELPDDEDPFAEAGISIRRQPALGALTNISFYITGPEKTVIEKLAVKYTRLNGVDPTAVTPTGRRPPGVIVPGRICSIVLDHYLKDVHEL